MEEETELWYLEILESVKEYKENGINYTPPYPGDDLFDYSLHGLESIDLD